MSKMNRTPRSPGRPLDCFNCQMRTRSEWCVLSKEEISLLDESKVPKVHPPGSYIFMQGDLSTGIYCIESGTVAIRKADAQGNSILLRLAHPGQTIGYRDYFAGENHTSSAEALTPATVCYVSRESLSALMDHTPSLGLQFLTHLAKDLNTAEDAILQHSSLSVRTRLAHLLLTLKERYAGVDAEGTLVISLPMTRQDMAALLGTRPETIARTIHAMEDDMVATFSGRSVVIPNLENLLNEIEGN